VDIVYFLDVIGRVLDVCMTRTAVGFSVQSNGEC